MGDTLTIERVPLDSLLRHPRNARTHNLAMIQESLRTHGQFAPLIVQRSTNHVLAGNGRHEAMEGLSWAEADVIFADVDDEQALKILLVDNRTSDQGDYREAELIELLQSLENLVGTGFDSYELDDLLAHAQEQTDLILDTVNNNEDTLNSWQVGYLAKTVRSVILDYEGEEYLWVIDRINELKYRFGVASNAEAVKQLIVEKYPELPPPTPKE